MHNQHNPSYSSSSSLFIFFENAACACSFSTVSSDDVFEASSDSLIFMF